MTVKTYLKRNENIKRFYIQCKGEVCECDRDSFNDINLFGCLKIKDIDVPVSADELVTLFV